MVIFREDLEESPYLMVKSPKPCFLVVDATVNHEKELA